MVGGEGVNAISEQDFRLNLLGDTSYCLCSAVDFLGGVERAIFQVKRAKL